MTRTRKIRVPSAVQLGTLALALATLGVGGCSQTDPYQRSGTWKPSGVNDANIAAQAANPADLTRGRAAPPGTMRTATTAVERMWQGTSQQRQQGQGQGQSQAGAGASAQRGSETQR